MSFISCADIKHMGLYDEASTDTTANIKGFEALSIYSDQITSDLWFTSSPACVQVKPVRDQVHQGNGALSISWNKQAGDCPWLGMGIGWNGWTGKDFSQIQNEAALSFWVKTKGDQYKGLPWAVGFEDFSGGQAWTGITSNLVQGDFIGTDWTQVIVPLSYFPFKSFDTDITAIKQVIFQFESSGFVYMDDIRIIPTSYQGKKTASVTMISSVNEPDGKIDFEEWSGMLDIAGTAGIFVNYDQNNLYIAALIKDESPGVNHQNNENIWNGDALEIAFSTESGIDPERRMFYEGDYHIGLKLGAETQAYDWTHQKAIPEAKVFVNRVDHICEVEAVIPWTALGCQPWAVGKDYTLEIALDLSGESGNRREQLRWNSPGVEGFNRIPALWGQMTITEELVIQIKR